MYNDFLKILNLFSMEIIDVAVLVERVEPFLGKSPELFEWFKKFVKYEDDIIFNIPGEKPEFDLQSCRKSGHSYRRYPSQVVRPNCSGRDELAKEVLNDDWFSHPVYVSETGFVSHKKTPYEEAMYRCEEERYEFDLNIESNLSVISILEPIARTISCMNEEEKSAFKLPLGLGGHSASIYQRVIKKVYDRDRGNEVIDALHETPSVAVPIILKRLKQKVEEWKRAQREWNKVWREIDAKNFAKSLDHQGIVFKASDRKAMNVRSLVTEIEVIHREQREKRVVVSGGLGSGKYQFDFYFKQDSVVNDVYVLLSRFLEGNMAISTTDEEQIKELLMSFLPKFFCLEESTDSMALDGSAPRDCFTFYANSNLYAFFRLYQMLFSRLLRMKELSDEMAGILPRSEKLHPVAVELGLQKDKDGTTHLGKDRYNELLKLIGFFITNELEPSDFEERTRNLFWTSGFLVFTIDRLVQATIKQLQLIVSDDKTMELISLYGKDRTKESTSTRQESLYRLTCESFIQDDSMFRLEFFVNERILTMQILGKDDASPDDTISAEEKWAHYVEQFVQLSATEGLSFSIKQPFLKRNLPDPSSVAPSTHVTVRSGLELKICINTYKIFFVDNTEDYFRRKAVPGVIGGSVLGSTSLKSSSTRATKFKTWNETLGWKAGLTPQQASEQLKKVEHWKKTGEPMDPRSNHVVSVSSSRPPSPVRASPQGFRPLLDKKSRPDSPVKKDEPASASKDLDISMEDFDAMISDM